MFLSVCYLNISQAQGGASSPLSDPHITGTEEQPGSGIGLELLVFVDSYQQRVLNTLRIFCVPPANMGQGSQVSLFNFMCECRIHSNEKDPVISTKIAFLWVP